MSAHHETDISRYTVVFVGERAQSHARIGSLAGVRQGVDAHADGTAVIGGCAHCEAVGAGQRCEAKGETSGSRGLLRVDGGLQVR